MINRQQHIVGFAGGDHAVGVGQRRGNWFFTENCFGAPVGGRHGDIGVQMIRGDDAHQIRLLLGQHRAIICVIMHVWPNILPGLPKLVQHFLANVTDSHHVRLWMGMVRGRVRLGNAAIK